MTLGICPKCGNHTDESPTSRFCPHCDYDLIFAEPCCDPNEGRVSREEFDRLVKRVDILEKENQLLNKMISKLAAKGLIFGR